MRDDKGDEVGGALGAGGGQGGGDLPCFGAADGFVAAGEFAGDDRPAQLPFGQVAGGVRAGFIEQCEQVVADEQISSVWSTREASICVWSAASSPVSFCAVRAKSWARPPALTFNPPSRERVRQVLRRVSPMPCLSSAATEWRAWRAVLRIEFGHPRLQSSDFRTQCHELVLRDHHQAQERKLLDLLSLEWCV